MKKITAATTGTILYFLSSIPAFAAGPINICPQGTDQFKALCDYTGNTFGNAIGGIITLAFVVAIVIALAFLIFGGIKWIISGGDKAGVEGARNTIVAAIVGLIVVFLSYFILNFVLSIFGLELNKLEIPKITF